jgi:hypothetical protein
VSRTLAAPALADAPPNGTPVGETSAVADAPALPAARTATLTATRPAAGRPDQVRVPPGQASMSLLYIWIVLFGFVGTQLAWTLRPFFGDPGKPFGLFREIGGTFYADVFRTIGNLLGG